MGYAVALLLVSTILPLGGIAEDIAPVLPEATVSDEQAHAQTEALRVSADLDQVSIEATDPGMGLVPDQVFLRIQLDHRRLPVPLEIGDLLSTALPVGPAGPPQAAKATVSTPDTEPAPAGAQASQAAVDGGLTESFALGSAGTAAALAALAVTQSGHGWTWVRRMARLAPLLALYSRIAPNEVLDHATRQAIYDLVTAEPGLPLGDIADELELSRSTARHHLNKLEEAGLIRHTMEGRCRIHFASGYGEEAVSHHLLRDATRARIAELLEARSLSLLELASVLEANPSAVAFHLKRMREAGLIERHEEASVVYRLTA